MKKLKIFLENVEFINDSIKTLLGETDQIIAPTFAGANVVDQKFTVIGDGKPPSDGEINLKNAKQYDINIKEGDEIDIPVISFENLSESEVEEKLKDMLEDGDLGWEDVQQMALASSSGKVRRTAAGAIKVGPKVLMATTRLALLGKLKKDIPHSQCYCLKLFDTYKDAGDPHARPPVKPKPNRETYESDLSDYINTVKDEFLEGWDECDKLYGKTLKDNKKRVEALHACPAVESFFKNAKEVLDSILSKMGKYYNIKGMDVKKNKLSGGNKGIAKTIGENDKIQLHFTNDVKDPDSVLSTLFAAGSDKTFDVGTYKEDGNVVKLIDGHNKYYFEFQKTVFNQEQAGGFQKDDGHGKPKTSTVTWKGWIIKYIN